MALSYLVGSYGNFGQAKINSATSTVHANPRDSVLVMTESEAEILVELLANSIHQRGKEGAGGYSIATFSAKYVLFAIRCLLTHTLNQNRMIKVAGRILNSLLLKSLALHSTRQDSTLDAESAEYACFSLYVLSNYGFKVRSLLLLLFFPLCLLFFVYTNFSSFVNKNRLHSFRTGLHKRRMKVS